MCSIQIPPKILEHIDKLRRHCLWNKKTDEGEKCFSLIAWDKVCRPKKKGGVGVLNLKLQNEALLLKHLHKFYNHEDVPWVTLLWKSYYQEKVPHAMLPVGSFWWRDIFKLTPLFRGIASCQVGDGTTVLFWKDSWMEHIASEKYPRAFSFALDADKSVQDFITAPTLADNFWLPVSSQAREEIRDLQNTSRELMLDSQDRDRWVYDWGATVFTSQKYYQYCFRDITVHAAYGWLWKSKCTPKMKFFCWLLISDRLNTRNMLRRRNICLNTGYSCMLCHNPPEETVEHLIFHCSFAKQC
jgi:hypothetical protein